MSEPTSAVPAAQPSETQHEEATPRRRSSVLVAAENLVKYGRIHPTERDTQSKKLQKAQEGNPKAANEKSLKSRFMSQFTF